MPMFDMKYAACSDELTEKYHPQLHKVRCDEKQHQNKIQILLAQLPWKREGRY